MRVASFRHPCYIFKTDRSTCFFAQFTLAPLILDHSMSSAPWILSEARIWRQLRYNFAKRLPNCWNVWTVRRISQRIITRGAFFSFAYAFSIFTLHFISPWIVSKSHALKNVNYYNGLYQIKAIKHTHTHTHLIDSSNRFYWNTKRARDLHNCFIIHSVIIATPQCTTYPCVSLHRTLGNPLDFTIPRRRAIKCLAHFVAKLRETCRRIPRNWSGHTRAEDEPLLRVEHNSHVIHSQPRWEYLQMGFKSGRDDRGGSRGISFAGT